MRSFFKIILVLLLLIIGAVATVMMVTKHKKLKVTENQLTTLYEPKATTLSFPLLISMNDIEKVANAKIKMVLVDKKIPLKNGNDTLILKVTRLGKVNINLRNAQFRSSVPLKLEIQFIKKVIGKKNIRFFKEKPLELFIDAYLSSAVAVTEDLKLVTKTELTEIKWLEEPNFKLIGLEFNVKDKVDEMMLEKAPEITGKIDELLASKVDLRKPAARIWEKLQRSIKASKKQKDLYVRVQPKALGIHVDKSLSDSLRLDLIVTSKVYVRFGEDTAQIMKMAFPKKVELITKDDTYASSRLYLHCLFPVKKLNSILKKELEGKEFSVKGLDLKIDRIEVSNGIRDIFVKVRHSGTISGQVIMRGFPELSRNKEQIFVKHIMFENKLDDEVANSMTDLLHEQLVDIIKDYSSFDIGDIMESMPDFARQAIRKSKLSKRADIELQKLMVDDLEIRLTKDNIQLIIAGRGDFGISLKKESFKILRKK